MVMAKERLMRSRLYILILFSFSSLIAQLQQQLTFADQTLTAYAYESKTFAVADFNSDGNLDILTVSASEDKFLWIIQEDPPVSYTHLTLPTIA